MSLLCEHAIMFYIPSVTSSVGSSESGDGVPLCSSKILPGLLDEQRKKGIAAGVLTITVVEGRNLPVMDPTGKSDPYCIVRAGNQEQRTSVQYSTVAPMWNETLQFDISGVPQLMQNEPVERVGSCCVHHYIQIDVWDYDTLNRDDFMGRIQIPVSILTENTTACWFPLGKSLAKDNVCGELFLEVALRASQNYPQSVLLNGKDQARGVQKKNLVPQSEAERVEMVFDDVVVEVSKHRGIGRMYLTNFRLVILCHLSGLTAAGYTYDMSLSVALNNIQSVDRGEDEKVVSRTVAGNAGFSDVKTMTVRCWDFRMIHLTFMNKPKYLSTFYLPPDPNSLQSSPDSLLATLQLNNQEYMKQSSLHSVGFEVEGAEGKQSVQPQPQPSELAVPQASDSTDDITRHSSSSSFQVLSRSSSSSSSVAGVSSHGVLPKEMELSGWYIYDFHEEFARQQVSDEWRVSVINREFLLCGSYPPLFYVPAETQDSVLKECAAFRSKGRLPVLCWYNCRKGNFMMRCAQPKTGPALKNSIEDEFVINSARKCNKYTDKLVIFDARSIFAAGGNMLKGKGTEDTVNRYQGCQLLFLDIPNIHAVRDSLYRLQGVCESSAQKKWLSHLESSQWLAYITSILKGAVTIARFVNKGAAALVHCSDGWDRTSQLTSLAQLLLDPFYRTVTGFQVLIEKEWISFGHRFRDRLGHPSCPSQRSPVFLQFLDCVWQVAQQFPSAFEFNTDYLLRIAEHVNSQWQVVFVFGNFLCNNISERRKLSVPTLTVSLWAHLKAVADSFKNPTYKEYSETLFPVSNPRRLRLWVDYFLRFDETAWSKQDPSLQDDDGETEALVSKPLYSVIWVPDDRARDCADCKQRFTQFRRKDEDEFEVITLPNLPV
ncbi:Myotubularin-related protein 2 [Acropora cervicornis]|uniref:Myotubularin-related protein 2 n=1 Tax=Acropora cervicornis TaxID=6130 RepID=A0AAD9V989_ACRCE|nr:Myotubularin-related protein 2 [Acropora cervicornis]